MSALPSTVDNDQKPDGVRALDLTLAKNQIYGFSSTASRLYPPGLAGFSDPLDLPVEELGWIEEIENAIALKGMPLRKFIQVALVLGLNIGIQTGQNLQCAATPGQRETEDTR